MKNFEKKWGDAENSDAWGGLDMNLNVYLMKKKLSFFIHDSCKIKH